MAVKTIFVCTNCGAESSKWYGRCPECGEWNTFQELTTEISKKGKKNSKSNAVTNTISLFDAFADSETRLKSGIEEFDRVLGGGIVKGSVVLLGGEPGAGKSTLLLQVSTNICKAGKVLYVSGEESASQIKLRAKRLGLNSKNLLIANETDVNTVINTIKNLEPELCIIDSIQTIEMDGIQSSAGSLVQVRECAAELTRCAKDTGIPVIIIGHVNKDGAIAGPKVMEHIVDTVLYLEGDRYLALRILRSAKNRYGSTSEIGFFDMTNTGMIGISDPSLLMLEGMDADNPGSCLTCIMEGTRPIVAEIQALTTKSSFSVPRRNSDGLDFNRVNLLLAVIEKRGGYALSSLDVYLNVTGGLNINETSSDLAIAVSIISSLLDKPVPAGTVVFGEIGLGGEIRSITDLSLRINEIQKLGFSRVVLPKSSISKIDPLLKNKMDFIGITNIKEIAKVFKNE